MQTILFVLLTSILIFNDAEVESVTIKSEEYFSNGGAGSFKFVKELVNLQNVKVNLQKVGSHVAFLFSKSNSDLISGLILEDSINDGNFRAINDTTFFLLSTKKTYLSFKNYPEGYGNHSFRVNTSTKQIEFFYAEDYKKSDSLIAILKYK